MPLTHLFCDIGGVLGTNGWDRVQRARAVARFGLDAEELQCRHEELVGELETGRIGLAEYLESVVFYGPRAFSREELVAFMLAQSEPFPDSIALVRRVAERGRVRMMTLNNESDELNRHRIEHFGLGEIFSAFLSSCWLGVRKPSRLIFERALGIAQVAPGQVLFVDDREQNLAPAQALGFRTLRFTGAPELERSLGELGFL